MLTKKRVLGHLLKSLINRHLFNIVQKQNEEKVVHEASSAQ